MERWIQGLYYYMLKHKLKVSDLIMSPEKIVYTTEWVIPGDKNIQEWIDGLQDK